MFFRGDMCKAALPGVEVLLGVGVGGLGNHLLSTGRYITNPIVFPSVNASAEGLSGGLIIQGSDEKLPTLGTNSIVP